MSSNTTADAQQVVEGWTPVQVEHGHVEVYNEDPATDPLPAFCRYPGQHYPQPAYLAVNPAARRVSVTYAASDSTPIEVHNNEILHTAISPYLTATQINDLLVKVAPLAGLVADGHTMVWNGRNMVGDLLPESQAAWDRISRICEPDENAERPALIESIWDLGAWDLDGFDWDLLDDDTREVHARHDIIEAMENIPNAIAVRSIEDLAIDLAEAVGEHYAQKCGEEAAE